MNVTPSSIFATQLAGTKTTIFASSGITIFDTFLLHNPDGVSSFTYVIYIKQNGGSSIEMMSGTLSPGDTVNLTKDGRWVISDLDQIEGQCSTASAVNAIAMGAIES